MATRSRQQENADDKKRAFKIAKEVANAYVAGLGAAERRKVEELFQSLDRNNDNRISFAEFRSVESNISFSELDSNSDGLLDRQEFLAFYYLTKTSVPKCIGCKSLLLDPYFSCLSCQAERSTYCLCHICYGNKVHQSHRHAPKYFFDTRAKLQLLDQILCGAAIEDKVASGLLRGAAPPKRATIWEKIQGLAELGNLAVSIGGLAFTAGCNIM